MDVSTIAPADLILGLFSDVSPREQMARHGVKLNRRKVAQIADPGPRVLMPQKDGFRAKNVGTTATNLRAGPRSFHKCTGKPSGIHLADETT